MRAVRLFFEKKAALSLRYVAVFSQKTAAFAMLESPYFTYRIGIADAG